MTTTRPKGATMKRPSYYAAPLKKTDDIIEWLLSRKSHYSDDYRVTFPLVWNVKVYDVNLEFDHLLDLWKKRGDDDGHKTTEPEWLAGCRAEYAEIGQARIYESGLEDARDQVRDGDTYRTLWDGTELDVEYTFIGRSGGYIAMKSFEGTNFTALSRGDAAGFAIWLGELPYHKLRNLYQLVVQCDHDFRREAVKAEVEHQAAFNLFENFCPDVPVPPRIEDNLGAGI